MSSIIHGIFEVFQGVADAIVGLFTTLFNAVFAAVQGAVNLVWQTFAVALNAVYHIFATAGDVAKHAGSFVLGKCQTEAIGDRGRS
jgi:phage-related protein